MLNVLRRLSGKRKYAFYAYKPAYAKLFTRERRRLLKALGSKTHLEHIGSTAVPGLGGKNILDIIVGTKKRDMHIMIGDMKRLGYEFMPNSGSEERLFFVRDATYEGRKERIHLHLVKFRGGEWIDKIAFRDYLKSNSTAMLEYANVKRSAVRVAKGDKERYMYGKQSFISKAMRKATRNVNSGK